ncbi:MULTISPECIES: Wadjet anti-phage system protein JetD domain-containing protein [unclassified Pseudomonas]|uniref:Wadjet anti-phage system protein JetD domain-containing protein n=1 Tax=unclassified Pseudomonas TaxID=196821 RepID=UPI002AC98631|nr:MULTISPECIES: Wadjet anti-phage system protein JetD domain-containing protein [unclassified Pseudomonas]MEB0042857.1 DUF2220 family protein [Pseudomonas sp. MH10]MEB0077752.1 DUF2220 family protein [Pseudomonas sp. MH10out]MEB0092441.1 DUF2220 family protein [Pseudomonas sp. CCI4.2]MEB0102865.1 DUF2220 family protein [Pseudomonas sp. CCI3.2]MEB0122332.1 DUF2220 family protein [Pseudomonas sp. CCI1.2]
MNWTTANDLKEQLRRLWARGDLLRPHVTGEAWVPKRLTLKSPSSTELSSQFEVVRPWINAIATIPHIRVEWREVNHRILGAQRVPTAAWVDTREAAIVLIGKSEDLKLFSELVAITREQHPTLLTWLAARPLVAIGLAAQWGHLLNTVAWIIEHPRPGIYLRQVDIPGIHSKFIEGHKVTLSELFDLVLPERAIAPEHSGVSNFAARYGFLDKPVRIRFRVLDDSIPLLPGSALADITLDAGNFSRLNLPVARVFITENETNFLAFPPVANAIVIFGAGYGWEALGRASWLSRCTIHYWGDIDTHGFAILDHLRRRFDHVESFLMDRETLMAHEDLWGVEKQQVLHDLPNLTDEERALFDEVRDNRIRGGLRLEQEWIGFGRVEEALRKAG